MFKIRAKDGVIRHVRLSLNTTVASASLLSEYIEVIFAALSNRKECRPTLNDVHRWLGPRDDAGTDEEAADDEEAVYAQEEERKLVNWKRKNRTTYFLVDWDQTWEPRCNVNPTVVAAFEKERRLLVRKVFIDDEAVEDNSLNATEA
ncbi:hypothetical protein PHMEG_00026431 [Phytophthora megakarya]|uniref:Chromo domain-containing protein n=1 Tax=Phytophthora megakarya TaxID=4795 RepID=A0A225VAU8_9STRA|nr:hypothetical protein PHMEG_00026431 [Phytophthora megakarya]